MTENAGWAALLFILLVAMLALSRNSEYLRYFEFEDTLGSWQVLRNRVQVSAPTSSMEFLHLEKLKLLSQLLAIEEKIALANRTAIESSSVTQVKDEGPLVSRPKDVINTPLKSKAPSSEFLLREIPDQLLDARMPSPPRLANPVDNDKKTVKDLPFTTELAKSAYFKKNCKYTIKVYVYAIPTTLESIRLGEEARRNGTLHICQKCILEQFALEYIIYDFFTQFCGRTYNPDEADFFYLPLIRDAEYRLAMEEKSPRKRAPSQTEQALLDVIEKGNFARWLSLFQVTDKYWKAHQGGDHIIVMPAPVTNLRHESSKRGHFHYMIHLFTPIFLGLEYSASFVHEYPVCATEKNIVMPYPTTDPDLFSGKLLSGDIPRKFLIYYAGGVHGDCVEIRKAMKQVLINSTRLPGVVPDVRSIQSEREHGFRAAKFCPIPVGDSPSSKRMYDVMNFGCIPVVLSDDLVWAFDSLTGGTVNRSHFSIQLPQAVVQFSSEKLLKKFESEPEKFGYLPDGESLFSILKRAHDEKASYRNGIYVNPLVQVLERISDSNIAYLQRGVIANAPKYRYYEMNSSMTFIPTAKHIFPSGGAMDELVGMLHRRKLAGIDSLTQRCQDEKKRPGHKYLHRYPCEPNDRRRLLTTYFSRGNHMR